MAYRLKTLRFRDAEVSILLQNENGPCPLLATANALLLKRTMTLPPRCIRNNVVSLDDLTNLLANQAILKTPTTQTTTTSAQQHGDAGDEGVQKKEAAASAACFMIDELMQQIPDFQYGMDVNLKFTSGPTGYEYTRQLNALDMWGVKLVHGWLLDPEISEELFLKVDGQSYNELVMQVISGKEATANLKKSKKGQAMKAQKEKLKEGEEEAIQSLRETIDKGKEKENDDNNENDIDKQSESLEKNSITHEDGIPVLAQEDENFSNKLQEQHEVWSEQEAAGAMIGDFLESTSHQLTHYGLQSLYTYLEEGEVCIFFRNNHFATMTKHASELFLLVTDLGYATQPDICWEKLDVIDGDTEYVNWKFMARPQQQPTTATAADPEKLLAQSEQNEADYQMALQLSVEGQRQGQPPNNHQHGVAAAVSSKVAPIASSISQKASSLLAGGTLFGNNTNKPESEHVPTRAELDVQEGKLMAAATEASLRDYHGLSDGIVDNSATPIIQQQQPGAILTSGNTTENEPFVAVGIPTARPPGPSPTPAAAENQCEILSASIQEDADRLLAMNLQDDEDASLRLARQLQLEEETRHAAAAGGGGGNHNATNTTSNGRRQQQQTRGDSTSANCTIS